MHVKADNIDVNYDLIEFVNENMTSLRAPSAMEYIKIFAHQKRTSVSSYANNKQDMTLLAHPHIRPSMIVDSSYTNIVEPSLMMGVMEVYSSEEDDSSEYLSETSSEKTQLETQEETHPEQDTEPENIVNNQTVILPHNQEDQGEIEEQQENFEDFEQQVDEAPNNYTHIVNRGIAVEDNEESKNSIPKMTKDAEDEKLQKLKSAYREIQEIRRESCMISPTKRDSFTPADRNQREKFRYSHLLDNNRKSSGSILSNNLRRASERPKSTILNENHCQKPTMLNEKNTKYSSSHLFDNKQQKVPNQDSSIIDDSFDNTARHNKQPFTQIEKPAVPLHKINLSYSKEKLQSHNLRHSFLETPKESVGIITAPETIRSINSSLHGPNDQAGEGDIAVRQNTTLVDPHTETYQGSTTDESYVEPDQDIAPEVLQIENHQDNIVVSPHATEIPQEDNRSLASAHAIRDRIIKEKRRTNSHSSNTNITSPSFFSGYESVYGMNDFYSNNAGPKFIDYGKTKYRKKK